MTAVPPGPIPIYVLAGVLGSGKTTLMAKLARFCIAQERRVGMIVNDIASLGVDALVLAETGWPHAAVDSLDGACACCSDRADLEDVLIGMKELRRELLLFETTGIADAADMLNQITADELRRLVQTPRLITVIDATRYPDPLVADPLVQRQVALADLVVLSKTDLVDEERIASARQAVRAGNPAVSILEQPLADPEMASLLDRPVQHQAALGAALIDGPPGHGIPHTLTVPLPGRLSAARFDAFLHGLPATILRAKGFVALDVGGLHVFQYVEPGFVHIAPFQFARRPGVVMAPGVAQPYGVFIGTTIDEAELVAALKACTADS